MKMTPLFLPDLMKLRDHKIGRRSGRTIGVDQKLALASVQSRLICQRVSSPIQRDASDLAGADRTPTGYRPASENSRSIAQRTPANGASRQDVACIRSNISARDFDGGRLAANRAWWVAEQLPERFVAVTSDKIVSATRGVQRSWRAGT